MIDLSFLIPLVVIVVVMAKVSKEFSKVSRNRPTGGGSDDGTSGAGRVEGARSIAEFLEELKRQAQATQAAPSASAESDETLQARLREKVREAARLRREAAGHGQPPSFESPPPLPREEPDQAGGGAVQADDSAVGFAFDDVRFQAAAVVIVDNLHFFAG